MKTNSRTTEGQAKDTPPSPNPLVKAPRTGRHWVSGPNRRRATKEQSTATNNDWADNQACSPPHNIQATANPQPPELLRKVRPTHNPSKPAHQVTVKLGPRHTPPQKCSQTDAILPQQGTASASKPRKRPTKPKTTTVPSKKFGSKGPITVVKATKTRRSSGESYVETRTPHTRHAGGHRHSEKGNRPYQNQNRPVYHKLWRKPYH